MAKKKYNSYENAKENPWKYYQENYEGMGRSELQRKHSGFYTIMLKSGDIERIPRKNAKKDNTTSKENPIQTYERYYDGLNRLQLNATNPQLYQAIKKQGDIKKIPVKKVTVEFDKTKHDPWSFYQCHYSNLGRSELYKASSSLYRMLSKTGELQQIDKKPMGKKEAKTKKPQAQEVPPSDITTIEKSPKKRTKVKKQTVSKAPKEQTSPQEVTGTKEEILQLLNNKFADLPKKEAYSIATYLTKQLVKDYNIHLSPLEGNKKQTYKTEQKKTTQSQYLKSKDIEDMLGSVYHLTTNEYLYQMIEHIVDDVHYVKDFTPKSLSSIIGYLGHLEQRSCVSNLVEVLTNKVAANKNYTQEDIRDSLYAIQKFEPSACVYELIETISKKFK